jgi:hypothetical protein
MRCACFAALGERSGEILHRLLDLITTAVGVRHLVQPIQQHQAANVE